MKRKKRILSLLTLVCLMLAMPCAVAYKDLPGVDIQARSAILVYAETDEILFGHNVHIRREPASITKALTALLAIEHGDLDDVVTAEEDDFFDIIEGGSNAGIVPGEEMTLLDLLYCAMLPSANEACNIIARHISGSADAFVELMNERLAELGCENTRFTNTHGLPDDNHYSTAYDLYLLGKEVFANRQLMEIADSEHITLPPTNKRPDGRRITNTNRLITPRTPEYYSYAHGIKTGRTDNAGHCLLSAAERDGIAFVSVILGAGVDEETSLVRSFTETRELFEWGYANFELKNILGKNEQLKALPVHYGLEHDEIYLVPEESVRVLIPKEVAIEDIERRVTVHEPYLSEGVSAPITQGDVFGEVSLSYQGHEYGTIPLLANKDVARSTVEAVQDGFLAVLSSSWLKWGVVGAVGLVALYILFAVLVNRRRRHRNMSAKNYRGRKRY